MKTSNRAKEMFRYYSECQDTKRIPTIPLCAEGVTAMEAFTHYETHGVLLDTREPELLTRALNGKRWHGVTVDNLATDLLDRILFCVDLLKYPAVVQKEVYTLAAKKALTHPQWGWVPTFITNKSDFTTLTSLRLHEYSSL